MVDLTPEEVAARVHEQPDLRHLVWVPGLPSWVAPRAYPPVATALAALPPARIKYSVDGTVQELTPDEIAARMVEDPTASHRVWRRGLPDWVPARMLPEVAAAVRARGGDPATPATPTHLSYTVDGAVLSLTPAEIASRIEADPAANHLAWKRGMSGWLPASQLPEISAALGAIAGAAPMGVAPVAPMPAPPRTSPPSALPTASAGADPAAAIRAHLSRLDADAPLPPPALEPPPDAGEGGVSYEPPPLPGEDSGMVIEVIPADEVEEALRREGLE